MQTQVTQKTRPNPVLAAAFLLAVEEWKASNDHP